jgi:hypothetical protein
MLAQSPDSLILRESKWTRRGPLASGLCEIPQVNPVAPICYPLVTPYLLPTGNPLYWVYPTFLNIFIV